MSHLAGSPSPSPEPGLSEWVRDSSSMVGHRWGVVFPLVKTEVPALFLTLTTSLEGDCGNSDVDDFSLLKGDRCKMFLSHGRTQEVQSSSSRKKIFFQKVMLEQLDVRRWIQNSFTTSLIQKQTEDGSQTSRETKNWNFKEKQGRISKPTNIIKFDANNIRKIKLELMKAENFSSKKAWRKDAIHWWPTCCAKNSRNLAGKKSA